MIGRITMGKGFRGCLDYVFRADHQAEMVASNMLGETPRELAREFGKIRQLKENISKPVYHVSISSVIGEDLNTAQWTLIVQDYLERMGINTNKHQYVAVKHNECDHDHIHIVVNRIGADGKVWDNKNDRYKSKSIMREVERKYELTPIREQSKTKENVQERERGRMRVKEQY